jgi:uncharacterized protein (TIGR02001 family)
MAASLYARRIPHHRGDFPLGKQPRVVVFRIEFPYGTQIHPPRGAPARTTTTTPIPNMTPAQGLFPLALALTIAMPSAFAAGAGSREPYSASASSVSATATLASQYLWRGIRQSDGRPAAQLSLDYRHASGWSAGTWASSIGDRAVDDGWLEWDMYGGYSGKVGGLGYSATAYYYMYPGARVGGNGRHYDYGELAAGLRYKSVYARYYHTVTRDFFGIADARGTGYLDVGVKHEVGGAMTLNLHAGDARVAGSGNGGMDWRDLKAGLSRKFEGGWSLSGTYSRAFGAAGNGAFERYASAMPRTDLRPLQGSRSPRGAVVMTLSRRF